MTTRRLIPAVIALMALPMAVAAMPAPGTSAAAVTVADDAPCFDIARRGRGADDAPGDDRGRRRGGRGADDAPNHG